MEGVSTENNRKKDGAAVWYKDKQFFFLFKYIIFSINEKVAGAGNLFFPVY